MKIFSHCALGALLAVIQLLALNVSHSGAATVQFTNWSEEGSNTVIPIFTVSDDPIGKFKVTVDIDAALSPNDYGQITGIYFDLVPDLLMDADITMETVGPGGTTHTDFATNADSINGVTNLNLGNFDYVLGYKDGDLRGEVTIMFFVNDHDGAITLADWDRVGIRFQGVGESGPGTGSDKEVSVTTSVVPLPAALPLFLSALAGFGFIARRRKKKQAA